MIVCLVAVSAGACAQGLHQQQAGPQDLRPVPAPGMAELIRRYQTDRRYIDRFYSVGWSDDAMERTGKFLEEWTARLDAMDYDALEADERVDWHLLRRHVTWQGEGLALLRRRVAEMEPFLPFRSALQELELARRRMEPCDSKAAAGVLADVTAEAKRIRERVEGGRKAEAERPEAALMLTPVVALRGAGVLDGLAWMLDGWAAYYDGFDPEFGWWTRKPREECQKELRDLAKLLREEIAGIKGKDEDPLVGDPIGAEGLRADLEGEALCYTPEELIAIGEREFAWCEAEMKKAAAEMGLGDDWKAALARAKEDQMPPGQQGAFVRDESRAVIEFLRTRDLVTIPALCEEAWRVEMHSNETQKVLPFAVYGGQFMGVSYANEWQTHADKMMSMRGNNRHFTHIVTPHELIPGHHLQGYWEDRERAYRGLFSTPFLVEGWALYWEFRLWELGWAGATGGDAALDRVGMLFWRMHRAARIIVSLKFHLGQMTPAEMIEFLVERVGHERFGATSEVRRYIGGDYSPLYQCGYMLGGLQISAMRAEMVVKGGMSEKAFNDAVLGQNSIPIELMRAGLRGEKLPKDWKPGWRFGD
ncbi:hypothetical protein PHYC_02665 [Phycisphaerales bacterium]|nr:hypothetical protein PHYC_02665 [Phycisphaerales bacterium]